MTNQRGTTWCLRVYHRRKTRPESFISSDLHLLRMCLNSEEGTKVICASMISQSADAMRKLSLRMANSYLKTITQSSAHSSLSSKEHLFYLFTIKQCRWVAPSSTSLSRATQGRNHPYASRLKAHKILRKPVTMTTLSSPM